MSRRAFLAGSGASLGALAFWPHHRPPRPPRTTTTATATSTTTVAPTTTTTAARLGVYADSYSASY